MARRELDWAGATVEGGELAVPLTGEPDRAWKGRCEAVLVQLQHAGGTGSVANDVVVKKDRLVVTRVAEGAEEEVRHLLESLVLEANAGEEEPPGDDGPKADAAVADQRLTEAFQAFGADPDVGDAAS
jgi:hypothetical protein